MNNEEIGAALLDVVCGHVRERLPDDQAPDVEEFIRQYYRWVPEDELIGRGERDVYGAALAHWDFMGRRATGETKVRVYNPDAQQHGWRSTHTIVEVVADDMPFVVDSVNMELSRHGHGIHLDIHPVVRVCRDDDGRLVEVLSPQAPEASGSAECVMRMEIDRQSETAELEGLRDHLLRVLGDVRAAVEDWPRMREHAHDLIAGLEQSPPPVDPEEIEETRALLAWLDDGHFTYLGFRDYDLVTEGGEDHLRAVEGSGLGILRQAGGKPVSHSFDKLPPRARALARTPRLLNMTKSNSRATVHRPSYLDYVGVKRFDASGNVLGETRFLGLLATAAYRGSLREIPVVRRKIDAVLARTRFSPGGHDAKALAAIFESFPRDELFQVAEDDLFEITTGILRLGERQLVRLFVWRDEYERFLSCLVLLPRDRFHTDNRERIQDILREAFDAESIDFQLRLSESVLVRIHFVVRTAPGELPDHDMDEIEARIVAATRSWTHDLHDALLEERGEEVGNELFRRYEDAFPTAYRADSEAHPAVADIAQIEELSASDGLGMSLYRPLGSSAGVLRCKLFRSDAPVSLSEVLPMFENMGVDVTDERPYEVRPHDASATWICDFGLDCADADLEGEGLREVFQDAFAGIWRGEIDNDAFNELVLRARLTWREVEILRAIAHYLRQTGLPFSNRYMARALLAHTQVARALVELFVARFDPASERDAEVSEMAAREIEAAIEAVQSLDEDRILRSFMAVVNAMLRTSYFQPGADGTPKPYLSFKVDPSQIPLLPHPRPRFEIFVTSPWTEGVHLRGGSVARGGLRWSDRREDFRTEVLGLVKAQMVKNAVIVPVGAKGGFVVRHPPADRDALRHEVVRCYRTFISALLDLTDNVVDGAVVPPAKVVRYDEDDPYLVVAADKGTATFSDLANQISAEYGFWLGDAFASGGSVGYDHKRMGITARSAWESVKRHFRELGVDTQTTAFTVVGIGDMSGDVFGNGMLLSEHIRLVAGFDHRHVFIDPDPDAATSFAERRRLFELAGSSWEDYDAALISEGGGVWPRSAKSITLSPQAQRALGIEADRLAPAELIRALLCAPVDLLFNGGIGTYVKAEGETHADVGDKANDGVRVDGGDLRCKVVGEGGNLGLTQRGRIEFALGGGRINTDAIDNAGGVNCSDREVNIKILLDAIVTDGDLGAHDRDELLAGMTEDVAALVLGDSYRQTLALGLGRFQAPGMLDVHDRFMRSLEQTGRLDRELEALPDADAVGERATAGLGLTQPELAVLLAYSKITLYAALLDSELPEDPYLSRDLAGYFPPPLPERYRAQMEDHHLRREIIATHVTNSMVDRAGATFAFRIEEDTGAPPSDIARAYAVAREVFDMPRFWDDVDALDDAIDVETQLRVLLDGRKLVERATRWLLRNRRRPLEIADEIERFAGGARSLSEALPEVLIDEDREERDAAVASLVSDGVPSSLAERVASLGALFSTLDVVEVAADTGHPIPEVAALHFLIGGRLHLHWLRDRIGELPRGSYWEAMSRAALRDDLFSLHAELTVDVLQADPTTGDAESRLDAWSAVHERPVNRCLGILTEIRRASGTPGLTTLPIALRELRNLAQATTLASGG